MKVHDYKDFCCFNYISNKSENNTFELGDIVFIKELKEIGVIIQIHNEWEYRTDFAGNRSDNEISLATIKEIEEYRPELCKHISTCLIPFKLYRVTGCYSNLTEEEEKYIIAHDHEEIQEICKRLKFNISKNYPPFMLK